MTQEDKERFIKIATDWLMLNFPEADRKFWINDFVDYLEIML